MVPVSVDGQVLCLRGCDGDDYTSALHSLEQFLKKYLKKDMFFFCIRPFQVCPYMATSIQLVSVPFPPSRLWLLQQLCQLPLMTTL